MSDKDHERELLAKARDLVPYLSSESDRINANRSLPPAIFARIGAEGLNSLMRPRRFGGLEFGSDIVLRIAGVLAEGDGSAAWVYAILGSHDHLIGMFAEHVQEKYWNSDRPHCASSYVPTGGAELADGGAVLSGIWAFCSGVDHGDWIALGGLLPGAGGRPELGIFLLPIDQVEIVDDWNVMGLAGTGSKSVRVESVFVPSDHMLRDSEVRTGSTPGAAIGDNPLYRSSMWPLFGFSILAPAVGIARGAYNATLAAMRARMGAGDPMFESKKTATLMHLAEAGARIDAAEMLYERGLAETHDLIMSEQPLDDMLRVRNRRDQAFVGVLCRQALDTLMEVAGGRGIRENNPVQRALRDIYAISAHPASSWDSAALNFASVATGGPITELIC